MALIVQRQVVPTSNELGVIPDDFDLSTITTSDLVFAGVAIVAAFVLSQLAKRGLQRVLSGIDGMPTMAGNVIARLVSYFIMTLGIFAALEALGFSFGLVGSTFLVTLVLVVLAAKPLLQDLSAGLILQLRRPFSIDDQVVIQDMQGKIDEVSARTVQLTTTDGREVHLPNRNVLNGAIVNLTSGGRRLSTFIVGASYDTDLDHAREVIATSLRASPAVFSDPPPEVFVEEFSDSNINIACRFWHEPTIEAEWAARDQAMRAVKRSLDDNGITIAFPQRVLWGQPVVG